MIDERLAGAQLRTKDGLLWLVGEQIKTKCNEWRIVNFEMRGTRVFFNVSLINNPAHLPPHSYPYENAWGVQFWKMDAELSVENLYPLGSKWKLLSGSVMVLKKTTPVSIGFVGLFYEKGCVWRSLRVVNPESITKDEWEKLTANMTFGRIYEDDSQQEPIRPKAAPKQIKPKVASKPIDPMCILCRANPARDCDCMKPKAVAQKSIKADAEPIARVGWDNVMLRSKYGISYMHVASETFIVRRNSKWDWESDCHPKTGKKTYLFRRNDESIEQLMERVEEHLNA